MSKGSVNFDRMDDEGNKFLNYKSITGMDLVPRIREPSLKKNAKDTTLDKQETNPNPIGI